MEGAELSTQPELDVEYPDEKEAGFQFELLVDEKERAELADGVNRLITKILKKKPRKQPDAVVFLDKSARPAAWLFMAMWKGLKIERDMPEIKFINIGQEKTDDDFLGKFDGEREIANYINRVKNSDNVVKLRRLFAINPEVRAGEEAGETLFGSEATFLGGKRIWVVDEFEEKGVSLMTAQALFEAAFNEKGGKVQGHTLYDFEPPWLRKESWTGVTDDPERPLFVRGLERGERGVDPRVEQLPNGRFIEVLDENENVSRQLRKEIHHLALEACDRLLS